MPTTISGTSITTASIDLTAPLSVADGGTGALVAFSATGTATTALPAGGWTKCLYATEEFDTNNNYDNSTNYRFTPTVAGYYQISSFVFSAYNATPADVLTALYKNGSEQRKLQQIANSTYSRGCGGSALVYANGTTDYFEIYHYSGGSTNIESGVHKTYFQAVLVRAA